MSLQRTYSLRYGIWLVVEFGRELLERCCKDRADTCTAAKHVIDLAQHVCHLSIYAFVEGRARSVPQTNPGFD